MVSDALWITHAMSNNHSDLACNSGKECICFRCGLVPSLVFGDTHVALKVIDGMFCDRAYLIKVILFFRIPLDAEEHAQFL